jgi:EPS-associated MarR family transcriptional regulator
VNEEHHYRVLKHLAAHPQATQRDLAKALGLSLGSTNYCIRAVIDRGWLKVQNFRTSHNKRAYAYLLTPEGIAAKAHLTVRFLHRKRAEYAALQLEIEQLAAELQTQPE